jgi:hypothetical protein
MTDSDCKFIVLLNTVVVVKAFSESSYSVDEQELATSVKEEVIFP